MEVLVMWAAAKAEKAYVEYFCILLKYHIGECCDRPRELVE